MVDVSSLGESNDGVDEHVGLVLAGSADGELAVSTVHGVARLERDDAAPRELVEVSAELGGSVCRTRQEMSWGRASGKRVGYAQRSAT